MRQPFHDNSQTAHLRQDYCNNLQPYFLSVCFHILQGMSEYFQGLLFGQELQADGENGENHGATFLSAAHVPEVSDIDVPVFQEAVNVILDEYV